MGSKVIVFLGILSVMVLLISSEVATRELAETFNSLDTSSEKTNGAEVDDAKYHGGHGGGGYGGGYPGHDNGRSGYCRYGCCERNYYRDGCRYCCSFAGEKPNVPVGN